MPLTQPKRDNPLMRRYFREIGYSGMRLAKRCRVSHSQIYMARKRTVGADNARKISRGVASILGLSEKERLELASEIMGHPGDLVRGWIGDPTRAERLLGVTWRVAEEIVSEEKCITHASGTQALARLREVGAPGLVIESVERRLMPPPERPPGTPTHNLRGAELAERKRRTKEGLRDGKPKVYEALRRTGLTPKDIRAKTGLGRETVRRALYGEGLGAGSARKIAAMLGEGLPEGKVLELEEELRRAPRNNL